MQSAKTRPGADCGSDHELLIAKFRLKLKKVGKTSRPFRYDLNQMLLEVNINFNNDQLSLIFKRFIITDYVIREQMHWLFCIGII